MTNTAQEFWVNDAVGKGVIPIMRAASSSVKEVLRNESGWTEEHQLQSVHKGYIFYTVWREPYKRFLSAIGRELQDILDQHPGNEKTAMSDTIESWNNDPDMLLDLTHTISQRDICVGATNEGTTIKVFRFDLVKNMMEEALDTVTTPQLMCGLVADKERAAVPTRRSVPICVGVLLLDA